MYRAAASPGRVVARPVSDLAPPVRERRFRWGLRTRSAVAAGVGALAVSVALSFVTYAYVRSYLVSQRDRVTVRQTFANARVVRDVLLEPSPSVNQLLSGLKAEPGGYVVLHYRGRWFSPSVGISAESLPTTVRAAVEGGVTGRQKIRLNGQPYQLVSVALPAVTGSYVEVFPLGPLDRTLETLRTSLVLGSLVATAGGGLLGIWSSRRVLTPLRRVSEAAAAVSAGGLDTRLEPEPDPDLDRLVVAFNTMADVVQRRIEREARFAADVSHELRTPLAVTRNAAEVLARRRDELPDRSRQALDVLLRKIDRFDRVTRDLLELSQLEGAEGTAQPDEVLLGDLLPRIVRQHDGTDVPVVVSPPLRSTPIQVDRRHLERIVANLLDNARVHADGPLAVTAEVSARDVVVTVEDGGPGVPAHERDLIFHRFHRGAGASHRPGSGLGLALVAEHAARLGGTMRIDDRPGGGARFVLRFPLRTVA